MPMGEGENLLNRTVATQATGSIFGRLLRMLRPYYGGIALGILLLVLSAPCELFPALVWKYVTDDLILTGKSPPTPVLPYLFSFHGRIVGKLSLLLSAVLCMTAVYGAGEVMGRSAPTSSTASHRNSSSSCETASTSSFSRRAWDISSASAAAI